jgi:hypothetical protein
MMPRASGTQSADGTRSFVETLDAPLHQYFIVLNTVDHDLPC